MSKTTLFCKQEDWKTPCLLYQTSNVKITSLSLLHVKKVKQVEWKSVVKTWKFNSCCCFILLLSKLVMCKPQDFRLWAGSSLLFFEILSSQWGQIGQNLLWLSSYICTYRNQFGYQATSNIHTTFFLILDFRQRAWAKFAAYRQTGGPRLGLVTSLEQIIKTKYENMLLCKSIQKKTTN